MSFRSYDALRVFNIAAHEMSFTQTAKQLNLSKGAISYQIKCLEQDLGFQVFSRQHGKISLTNKGEKLRQVSQSSYQQIEAEISKLKNHDSADQSITIGMSTYFASRWLAPRLMNFTSAHPNISLRLQPMIDLIDLRAENIDMAIRWGNGNWPDLVIEQLFNCPAKVTAGKTLADRTTKEGLNKILKSSTLLHDRDDSMAWQDWHRKAGITYKHKRNDLVIPDPNVRVEAVINGQGLALNDSLIDNEISSGKLFQLSTIELDDYGYYLAYPKNALSNPALGTFTDWIIDQSKQMY